MFSDDITKKIAAAAAQIKTEPPKDEVNTKSVEGAVVSIMTNEELKGNQHKIDANKNGKIDSHDFKLLRGKKKMNEDDTGYQDRYAVKDGKAVKHNPMRGERDEPHHVWADSAEHAVRKHAAKTAAPVKEDIEQLDEIGDTARGQYLLSKTRERAKDREYSATSAGKPSQVRKQRSVASSANARMTDNTRIYGASAGAPSLKSRIGNTVKKATSAIKKVLAREEMEQINELDAAAIAAYKASPASNKKSSVPHRAGPGPSKFKEKMASVSRTAEKGHDYFGHDTKRQQSGYRGPGQSVMQTAADKVKKGIGAIKKVFSREEVETIFNDFTLDEIHMFMMSEEFEMLHVETQEQIDSYLEERTLNEGFPTVADAKKRMAAGQSSFEKKKVSTGTVYQRKYKAEPDEEDMPKKKAKTMKEMLSIYKQHGAESLVENLMIEEPSQDEYKKETEIAQAKSEGKIRNDKGIAKPATMGVKMEEVEIEVLDANEINGVQIDNIEERSMTEPEMKKREEIVKSMKKGIQGFKDRYGDRTKEVMYATATKQAMKEETESEHYKAGHAYASDHAQDSGFKVTARARKKEMLADNPHKKGTPEHADWHRGALHGHQMALDNM